MAAPLAGQRACLAYDLGDESTDGTADVLQRGFILLRTGLLYRTDDRLGRAARMPAVATTYLSGRDRIAQGLLRLVIRCRDRRIDQEHEPLGVVVVQMLGKRFVGLVAARSPGEIQEFGHVAFVGRMQSVRVALARDIVIAHLQGPLEQMDDLARERFRRSRLGFFQVMGAP